MIINRIVVPALVFALTGALGSAVVAQDDLQPTTELGVTVTPDDIYDSIQETTDFWPPVRAYVGGARFDVATPDAREATEVFLKQAHTFLHHQLFEKDEATAMDLIDYLSWRIRRFTFLRQMREVLNDDALLAALKDDWERLQREANDLPADKQHAAQAAIPTAMASRMNAAGVEKQESDQVLEMWRQIAVCIDHMDATEAGQGMLGFEEQAKSLDLTTGTLIRDVVSAAEWTLIIKPKGTLAEHTDFRPAWDSLLKLRAAHTAATVESGNTRTE